MKFTIALLLGAVQLIKLNGNDENIWTPKITDDGYIKLNYPGQKTW